MKVVREGGVKPLLSLAHSPDHKVQRNAAGALLNLTHIGMFVCMCVHVYSHVTTMLHWKCCAHGFFFFVFFFSCTKVT